MHDAYVNARGFKNVFYAYVQFYFQGTVLDSLLFSKHSKRSRGIKQEWNQTFLYKRNSKSFIHSIQNRVQGLSTKYSFKHKGKYNIKKSQTAGFCLLSSSNSPLNLFIMSSQR